MKKRFPITACVLSSKTSGDCAGTPSGPSGQNPAKVPAFLITDIDGTLVLGPDRNQAGLRELKSFLSRRTGRFAFGVATGRRLKGIQEVFAQFELPGPDVVIASVGTEIHYSLDGSNPDSEWAAHLDYRWDASAVHAAASRVAGLIPQPAVSQNPFKVSYFVESDLFKPAVLETSLGDLLPEVNVILTQNTHLDILPKRASKGRAIRYLCNRWGIPMEQLLVCGDSGNDLDMLAETGNAVVVSNYSQELEVLRDHPNVFFSFKPAAAGILDGMRHFCW